MSSSLATAVAETLAANALTSLSEVFRQLPFAPKPATLADPDAELEDLRLPEEMAQRVSVLLRTEGLAIEELTVQDRYEPRVQRQVNHLCNTRVYLVSIPAWILVSATKRNREAIAYLDTQFPPDSVIAITAAGLDVPGLPFARMFNDWRNQVAFVPWSHLSSEDLTARDFLTLLGLSSAPIEVRPVADREEIASPAAPHRPAKGVEVDHQFKSELVDILADQAANSADENPAAFFRNLVRSSDIPQPWKTDLAGIGEGSPTTIAWKLVDWALAREFNPQLPSEAVVATILITLIPKLGLYQRSRVLAILMSQDLVKGKARDRLAAQYHVPTQTIESAPNVQPEELEFEWEGPLDDGELQGFLKSPDLLNVGFLADAIQQAASVCRIENSDKKGIGTAFLVAPDLVLTCMHVVGESSASSANTLVVRFGDFGPRAAGGDAGTEFKLADDPIVASSPVTDLDFALLRLKENVSANTGIKTLLLTDPPSPVDGEGLHILQYPRGGSLKLGIDMNGVARVNQTRRVVQYVTSAFVGSSGSPCFDDNWRVVALHRRERPRAFGSIREGVLISAISSRIGEFID